MSETKKVQFAWFHDKESERRDFPALDSWEFIETFYPDYSHSDDILENDILSRIYEDDDIHDSDYLYHSDFIEASKEDQLARLVEHTEELRVEALRNMYDCLVSGKIRILTFNDE